MERYAADTLASKERFLRASSARLPDAISQLVVRTPNYSGMANVVGQAIAMAAASLIYRIEGKMRVYEMPNSLDKLMRGQGSYEDFDEKRRSVAVSASYYGQEGYGQPMSKQDMDLYNAYMAMKDVAYGIDVQRWNLTREFRSPEAYVGYFIKRAVTHALNAGVSKDDLIDGIISNIEYWNPVEKY